MTKQKQTKAASTSQRPIDRLAIWFDQSDREVDILLLILITLLTLVAFANTLNGAFVYDDTRQILQNPIVRDSGQFWKAFTSDVWAFKSGGTATVSDYWRPFFTLWLVFNERLFGLESTIGWHLANILLHIGTAVLAYRVLRQLKLTRPVVTAVVLLFALHPVHVETVAWISGSPDLLMGLSLLGAISLLLLHRKTASRRHYAAALLLYTIALLSKEAAILFPLLIFSGALLYDSNKAGTLAQKAKRAGKISLPFLLIAILYLVARVAILGQIAAVRPWQQPLLNIILTIPAVITFYLRQSIFPIQLGPSYPLRIIDTAAITLQNFWVPLLVVTLSLAVLLWLVHRSWVKQVSLLFFILFLLPAFNLNAFNPEQIVHDRYLYLPLLGFLLIAVLALTNLVNKLAGQSRFNKWQPSHSGIVTLFITAVLCLPLLYQTIRYNTTWKSDLALWTKGVETDPTSLFNTYQYGYYLLRDGRLDEAKEQMDAVIARQPLTGPYYSYLQVIEAHLERADIALKQERLETARADLMTVTSLSPNNLSEDDRANLDAQQQRAYERLALSYIQENELDSAVETLETARQTLPNLVCTFTTNLAVTLYLSGQKERALTELEGVRERVELEYTPLCKMSLFYLGQLYAELGRTAEASSTLQTFLIASEPFYDEQTLNLQQQAMAWLARN